MPGGRYPLVASAHMTVVTATVAGVESITACTPPIHGELPASTIAAMHLAGATDILVLGGVQAVAALAVGTESIAKVDLVAGPGNAYVAEAKRQLFGEVGIDLLAGPTEILVIADDRADPFVVAVDLLSQAEHGPDSPAVLITTSDELARRASDHVDALLPGMPTRDFAEPAWRDHGQIIVVDTLAEAYELADELAFEHVEVLTERPREALEAMTQLRRAVPRRGNLRLLRRQGDRDQPHAADQAHRPPYGRAVGGQVPEDGHLPGGRRPGRERGPGGAVRPGEPGRAVRGSRPFRRRARGQVRLRPARMDPRLSTLIPNSRSSIMHLCRSPGHKP